MQLSVLEEVETSFKAGNRGASFVTVSLGALAPLATYYHTCVVDEGQPVLSQWSTYLAAGGLVYSGLTIYRWMYSMLSHGETSKAGRIGAGAKALGFVVLTEGTLAHPPNWWIGAMMLIMLMVVNAISMHARAVLAKATNRSEQRRARASAPVRAVVSRVVAKKPATRRAGGKKSVPKLPKPRLKKVG